MTFDTPNSDLHSETAIGKGLRGETMRIEHSASLSPERRKLRNRVTEFLNHTPNANRLDINAFSCAARFYVEIGRFLLMLTAVSLITMPLTQHIWTWDHFLQGGQDFEFGSLAILSTLSMVLLMARHCKQSVDLLLAVARLFSFICDDHGLTRTSRSEAMAAFCSERVFNPVPGIYSLPLQI
jgi:hypothetical protein